MIGTPTKAEKPNQTNIWWHVLLIKRPGHLTNQSKSSDETSTISQRLSAPAAAITHAQPYHQIHQNEGVHPPNDLKQRSLLQQAHPSSTPHILKNNHDKPQLSISNIPETNSNPNPTSTKTHKIHLHILTYGSGLQWADGAIARFWTCGFPLWPRRGA